MSRLSESAHSEQAGPGREAQFAGHMFDPVLQDIEDFHLDIRGGRPQLIDQGHGNQSEIALNIVRDLLIFPTDQRHDVARLVLGLVQLRFNRR